MEPASDPYLLTARWINAHVSPGQTIWVLPDYMTYPLMFHAPEVVYAWQLPQNPPPSLRGLNPAMYRWHIIPDYLVCFGPDARRILRPLPLEAKKVATIDFYWHDLYRPELAWRMFSPVTDFQPESEAIYLYQLHPSLPSK